MRKTLQDSGMKGRPRCIRPAVPEGRLEVRLQLVEEARHCSERPLTQLLTEVVWGSSAARHAAGREGFGTEMDGLSKTAKVISVTNRHTNNRTALTRGPARVACGGPARMATSTWEDERCRTDVLSMSSLHLRTSKRRGCEGFKKSRIISAKGARVGVRGLAAGCARVACPCSRVSGVCLPFSRCHACLSLAAV